MISHSNRHMIEQQRVPCMWLAHEAMQERTSCKREACASRLWELVDADTWTLDFMEKNPQLFPWASFSNVLQRLCAEMHQALPGGAAREMLIAADAAGSGMIPFRRFHVRQKQIQCAC